MKKLSVGLVGCGNIGAELAEFLKKEFSAFISLKFVCEHHPEKAAALKKRLKARTLEVVSLDRLLKKSDLIIESACPEVASEIVRYGIKHRKKMLIMSAGGLLDVPKYLLKKYQGYELYVPSGAIAGVDALSAAGESQIKEVRIVTSKPFAGLSGTALFEKAKKRERGKKKMCLFKGNALEAIKAFPRNVNVSAVLSLAGVGPASTHVEVWASPHLKNNRHEILIEGRFGKIKTCVENVPSPGNPKTSYLAILSAKAMIRKIFSPVIIGT